jgi:hypothetical protein
MVKRSNGMGMVERLETQVEKLGASEFDRFSAWFEQYRESRWDRQIEADAQSGKLAELAQRAREHHAAGRTTKI